MGIYLFQQNKRCQRHILAEFNYKLLNNLLSNNLLISKWNTNITNKCKSCISQIENTKHFIFECINVQNIWKVASRYLNFDILWKHIVVGFYLDKSETTKINNSFISNIAYRIYISKMYYRIEQIDETYTFIKRIKYGCNTANTSYNPIPLILGTPWNFTLTLMKLTCL